MSRQDSRILGHPLYAMLDAMNLSAEEIRNGLRNGTVVLCLPAAHENFTTEFLEEFSERILKQHWLDVAFRTHLQIPALLGDDDSMDDLVESIQDEYGIDVTDLPDLPFWEVIERCARSANYRPALTWR